MKNREEYYMDKLNIEDIENVAGGLTEEELRLLEQARKDAEDFADYGDNPWEDSKKNKGSLQSAMAKRAFKALKQK